MDLLKLKLYRTDNLVGKGNWREYRVEGMPEIETVLIRVSEGGYPETLDIMILEEPEPQVCTARFLECKNKISVIKALREVTQGEWGLKESKDFADSFPRTLTKMPEGVYATTTLADLVAAVNNAGGKAEMVIGKHCDKCDSRFRCFTER